MLCQLLRLSSGDVQGVRFMATRIVVLAELSVCVSCAVIIGNGEDTSQPDGGIAHGRKMTEHYGAAVMSLELAEGCEDFSTSPCGVCGDYLAGERHKAVELGRKRL